MRYSRLVALCLFLPSGALLAGCSEHLLPTAPPAPATILAPEDPQIEPKKKPSPAAQSAAAEHASQEIKQEAKDDREVAPVPQPAEARDEERPQAAEAKQPPEKVARHPEKPEHALEEPATALQKAPGPKANDRLLELLEKDLDKATEQPSQPRRVQFSLPVVENEQVRYFVDYFSRSKRFFFADALARSGRYVSMMAEVLREENLPEDLAYLALIESAFTPHALSNSDAVGLWQFVRGTALSYGLTINPWIDERKDPLKSTRAAAAYLKDLHGRFGRWYLAAAAYNAGGGKVGRALNASGAKDFWSLSRKSSLSEETRNFVPKFIAAVLIARDPAKYGFDDIAYDPPLEYDEVNIHGLLRLETVAELAETTVEAIRELNPALLRNFTPPGPDAFALRLPAGKGQSFAQAYERLGNKSITRALIHRVKKGETLWAIARRYGRKVSQLMEVNGLTNHRIRPGQDLVVLVEVFRKSK